MGEFILKQHRIAFQRFGVSFFWRLFVAAFYVICVVAWYGSADTLPCHNLVPVTTMISLQVLEQLSRRELMLDSPEGVCTGQVSSNIQHFRTLGHW